MNIWGQAQCTSVSQVSSHLRVSAMGQAIHSQVDNMAGLVDISQSLSSSTPQLT